MVLLMDLSCNLKTNERVGIQEGWLFIERVEDLKIVLVNVETSPEKSPIRSRCSLITKSTTEILILIQLVHR